MTWRKLKKNKTAYHKDEKKCLLENYGYPLGTGQVATLIITVGLVRLTWIALKAAATPRGSGAVPPAKRKFSMAWDGGVDNYKGRVDTLLLVATLVATVTFAAGFTMPGGFIDSGPVQGTATMVKRPWFHAFVFCNSIAMHGAIIVAVSLIWAQLGDSRLVVLALRLALPLLGVSLTTMSLAFLAGVYLVVSTLDWLATAFLSTRLIFLAVLVTLYILFWLPMSSRLLILRYISYYPFLLLASIAEMQTDTKNDVGVMTM